MPDPGDLQEITVCPASQLGDRQTAKFHFLDGADQQEGFVVRLGDTLFAWRNECRHIPVTLDWVENRFWSRDGCFLQCATHGALYDPKTGLCVDGPPAGESLRELPVEIRGGEVVVRIPRRQD